MREHEAHLSYVFGWLTLPVITFNQLQLVPFDFTLEDEDISEVTPPPARLFPARPDSSGI